MAVYTEFSVDADEFPFGQALSAATQEVVVELERTLPTEEKLLSYIWVHGCAPETVLQRVRDSPSINEITLLDDLADRALFRLAWESPDPGLLDAFVQADAAILEGAGEREWRFLLRFQDHSWLAEFHNACQEIDIPLRLDRVFTMVDGQRDGFLLDLSPEQRAALIHAVDGGYYDVPRGVTLEDVAEELGITRQAASERVRRGSGKVLSSVLLASTSASTR